MFLAAAAAADAPATRPAIVARIGNATVRVSYAGIDRVKLRARGPKVDEPDSPERRFLLIRLEISNLGAGGLPYRSYSGTTAAARDHASLRDSPRHYVTLFDFGDYEPEGLTREATIPAGRSITDLLVFDLPAETADLTLFLPQGNLGGAGLDRILSVKLP
jgi:hypothetical protein